jgi:transaldolase
MIARWIDRPKAEGFLDRWGAAIDEGRLSGICVDPDAGWGEDTIAKVCDRLQPHGGRVACIVDRGLKRQGRRIAKAGQSWMERIGHPNAVPACTVDEAGVEALAIWYEAQLGGYARHVVSSGWAMRVLDALDADAAKPSQPLYIAVDVAAWDRALNAPLSAHHLAQNRIGFFMATKIYNQIEQKEAQEQAAIQVVFADLRPGDPSVSEAYYFENLTLPGAILSPEEDLFAALEAQQFEESFHFQTRHLDAFFSFLAPAQIALGEFETQLLQKALKEG